MNSIKSVPARVLSRRGGHSLEAEREQFDKSQAISISKAINTQEAPVKEKHARRIILGTHHEKGAFTFWSYAIGLPLPSSAILSWKFCHVLHKVLRDGHPNVLQDCQRYRSNIRETGDLWGHLHDRYGQLVSIYTRLLLTKISFHVKHPEFPPGLEVSDEVLEKTAGTDVNNIFQLTVELFDYLDCELKLSESVFRQLNTSMAVSQMSAVQCRLAPLIQVIQDCSHLYHYSVKLMFKLHSCLPADTLQGHRDRFHEQFRSLKNFFKRASDMLYFKRLIQIPRLPESPPNFLRASALAEHVKPVVVIPEEAPEDEEPENLIEISTTSTTEPQITSDLFEQTFGPPNGVWDDRDAQIESLKKEVETLRAEMEKIKLEAQRYITQLKAQVNSLEGEVEEQRKQKQKALVDNEQLRDELERLQRAKQDSDRSQRLCAEAEKKANATEIRYTKLKEKHSELINTHAELLRKNADTAKQLTVTQQSQEEVARVKEQLAFQVEQVKREAEMKLEDQSVQMEQLRQELDARRDELEQAQRSLSHAKQAGVELSAQLDALHAEKEVLRRSVSEKECELLSTRGLVQEKELQLSQEADKATREIRELQGRLLEKSNQEQSLQQKLLDEQFGILQETVREAQAILTDALAKLDDPLHLRCTSSPDYLLSRAQAALESTDALEKGHAQYVASMADAAGLVGALALFAHLAGDTIVNGSATAHLAPTDHADRLTETCRECGQRSLEYLEQLKDRQRLGSAQLGHVQGALRGVLQLAQELRPKSLDIKQEELGDMVEKEMASTSEAIEDAVRRIEEMMSQARNESSGVKLEVNERILNSCTDLMKAIRLLVTTSTNLQKEIVESGRGAATTQEFYAKNSRWTEGLISASKAVGWGATQLVESADRVVLHTGKYEELIVCSHEIAASTAQLVAASKVKAEKSSRNLARLQECSRNVNEMAANVVASTKSGQEQIEEKDTMDFSGMSLIKLKKEEMETQVKVLELEKRLEGERVRLGELRKQHYGLAGGCEDAPEDGEARPAPAPRRGILKKPPIAQKPGLGEGKNQTTPTVPTASKPNNTGKVTTTQAGQPPAAISTETAKQKSEEMSTVTGAAAGTGTAGAGVVAAAGKSSTEPGMDESALDSLIDTLGGPEEDVPTTPVYTGPEITEDIYSRYLEELGKREGSLPPEYVKLLKSKGYGKDVVPPKPNEQDEKPMTDDELAEALSSDFTCSADSAQEKKTNLTEKPNKEGEIVQAQAASSVKTSVPPKEKKTKSKEEMKDDAMDALLDTLGGPEPEPEEDPTPIVEVSEAKAKEKKEQKAGERDDTIPPEYRLTPELDKDGKPILPKPEEKPKPMSESDLVDEFSKDFACPAQPAVKPKAPKPCKICKKQSGSVSAKATEDKVVPRATACTVQSAAPVPSVGPLSDEALEALSSSLGKREPDPDEKKPAVDKVKEKSKKEQHKKLGEEEETIPPEYRLTEAKDKDGKPLLPKPEEKSQPMSENDLLEGLTEGFSCSPSPPAPLPTSTVVKKSKGGAKPASSSDVISAATVSSVHSAAPAPSAAGGKEMDEALDLLSDSLGQREPDPDENKPVVDKVKEKAKSEHRDKLGERDETIPPDYRKLLESGEQSKPEKPTAKDDVKHKGKKKPTDDSAAIDALAGDFDTCAKAPATPQHSKDKSGKESTTTKPSSKDKGKPRDPKTAKGQSSSSKSEKQKTS